MLHIRSHIRATLIHIRATLEHACVNFDSPWLRSTSQTNPHFIWQWLFWQHWLSVRANKVKFLQLVNCEISCDLQVKQSCLSLLMLNTMQESCKYQFECFLVWSYRELNFLPSLQISRFIHLVNKLLSYFDTINEYSRSDCYLLIIKITVKTWCLVGVVR